MQIKPVCRIPLSGMGLPSNPNYIIRLDKSTNTIEVLERLLVERDITTECYIQITKSQSTPSRTYLLLMRGGRKIAIIDPLGEHKPDVQTGYRLSRPANTTYCYTVYKVD